MNGILLWVGVTLLIALALAVKLTLVGGLAAVVSRRIESDDAAVSGRWRLRAGGTGKGAPHGPASSSPEATTRVAGALRRFVERDVSWLKIERRHGAVRVVSSDATVMNYATGGSRIERRLSDGITVQATADWRGDELHLELSPSGDARVEEKYTPSEDRGCLEVEVQLIVPDAGLNMQLTRNYDRTENAGPI